MAHYNTFAMMHHLGLTLILISAQPDALAGWKTVSPKGAGFQIAMPGEPETSKRKIGTKAGYFDVFMWVAQGKNDTAFVASYCDFPDAELKKNPIEKRLDQARDGAVKSARGKLKSEKAIRLANHPGRDLVIEKDGKVIVRTRIYAVGGRLFQVMTLGPVAPKEAEGFLNSFRLKK